MKKIHILLIALIILSCTSCNEEVTKEQYSQLVSFKANINSKGITPIYVRYKPDGIVDYSLPIIVSGTKVNKENLDVYVGIDSDTLKVLNEERFNTRKELYYKELQDNFFEMPEFGNVNANNSTGLFPISFSLKGIDLVEKWVLPLTIEKDPHNKYEINTSKHFSKALMRILPFNDYSGDYNATAFKMYFKGTDNDPIVTNTKTAYVVDEKTIFIYAGIKDEDEIDRKDYKIIIKFNSDKTLSLTSENVNIGLVVKGEQKYAIDEEMDATRPYLKHIYVTLSLDYNFIDVSIPGSPIEYTMRGSLIMERKINTQIPDEDQAIEW